ncbi:LysR substrate-binding domain-containing protein [Agarivorans sp. QJM3NY_29]|uniref:LysR family transcriptional regulator n=1 Tax=unclassified Agarivorans TaxID=2636026 RepID=UPI003D7D9E61
MNLRSIDLNLLLILQQLLNQKHVSKTARSLNISQPSVSRALQKLRVIFKDELLVRTNQGYDLTNRAKVLLKDLERLIAEMETLFDGQQFEPANSRKTIKMFGLLPDINYLLPPFFKLLRQQAPNMTLDVDTIPQDHFSPLENGGTHFVLSAFTPSSSQQELYRMPIAQLEFKLVMNQDHPLAKQVINLDNLLECNFGAISIQGDKRFTLEQQLRNNGLLTKQQQLRVPLTLTNFNAAACLAEVSDIIFQLPAHFADSICQGRNLVARSNLKALKINNPIIYLYWHKRHHNDAMCCWVREQFKALYNNKADKPLN